MEPWGNQIENHRWGMWLSMYGNVHRDAKKSKKPFEVNDFLPVEYANDDPVTGAVAATKELTPDQKKKGQQALAEFLVGAFGGTLVDGNGKQLPTGS